MHEVTQFVLLARQDNALVQGRHKAMKFLKYQDDRPRFKPDADDATDTPFFKEDLIENEATVHQIVHAVFAQKHWKLGFILGFNFSLTLFEFIAYAPNNILYFGDTQHKVSAHASDCLRGQYRRKVLERAENFSPIGPAGAVSIGLEAITLFQIQATPKFLAQIEMAVIGYTSKKYHARMFLKRMMNTSLESSSMWKAKKLWRLYRITFVNTKDIEPSTEKKQWEAKQEVAFAEKIRALKNGTLEEKDILAALEEDDGPFEP